MSALAAKDRIIAALDVPSVSEAEALCLALRGRVGLVKVGLELFVAEGPRAVEAARKAGHAVFLDLKLHDIPNTVEGAARSAAALGASMLTVHASGGRAMIAAARKGLHSVGATSRPPLLLAVTVLTSLGPTDLTDQAITGSPEEQAVRLARLAVSSGGPVIVVPGIRPAGSARNDQARAATPADAIEAGADYLVVGRPLREGGDPAAAAARIAAEIEGSTH